MFYGRDKELKVLEEKYISSKSELCVIYGRRRIGKTSLVKKFIDGKPYAFTFEGIEGERSDYQIRHFAETLINYTKDSFVQGDSFSKWDTAFLYLTEKVIRSKHRKKKVVLFFDEIQWMAAGRSRLVAIIKYFWDSYWKDQGVMLILCGSIASFMINKVISSKALYGRISAEILLKGLGPHEVAKMLKNRRSKEEVLRYQLVFGGVPKYLEEINLDRSFNQNMNTLCFSADSAMLKEIEKIFYSQFRLPENYIRIINLLKDSLLSLNEIALKLGKTSGGSLREALSHLENAEIISSFIPFDKGWSTKFRKYRLFDEYLIFYYKFMAPHIQIISEGVQKKLFEMITKDKFNVWLGFAFERFCLKQAFYLAEKMGFSDQVIAYGPFFSKKVESFQIDLIYKRIDNVITVCEVKHHSKEITPAVILQMERKISLLNIPRGFTVEKALISLYGPDKALHESEYFNYHLAIDDIIP